MIAVILAAGKGSRLKGHTTEKPKSLLPLNDKVTLLDYNINMLNSLGVSKILIVTGFQSEKIEQHVSKYSNITCVYNPFWNQCNVLGSLYMAIPYIDADFLFLHADTLVGPEAWKTLKAHGGDIVMPYKRKVCGEEEMKVILSKEGRLVEINKTMNAADAEGEFLGIAKFSVSILSGFKKISAALFKTGKLDFYMEAAVQEGINGGMDIRAFEIGDSPFIEVDFEEDYMTARRIFG